MHLCDIFIPTISGITDSHCVRISQSSCL